MSIQMLFLSLIIGWIRKGSLKNFVNLHLRAFYLLYLAFFLQLLAFILHYRLKSSDLFLVPFLYTISFVPLILWTIFNRHYWEMWLLAFGLILNFLVISINGGKMPIYRPALQYIRAEEKFVSAMKKGGYYRYKLSEGNEPLFFLSDYIPWPPRFILDNIDLYILPRRNVFSPGDLIMSLGICFLIQRGMLIKDEEEKI
ncbi:DUF5317 domain-containing protein [bacterium]|nr:DUF5317 domain-containing protein [bacterium]